MTATFYVTTAIAYPNGEPHIGHAYEMIATDAIARWARLEGKDVFFLTGTDEHGIKMVQTAAAQGLTPRQLADQIMVERLGETGIGNRGGKSGGIEILGGQQAFLQPRPERQQRHTNGLQAAARTGGRSAAEDLS